jgi:hypothetical protein
MDEPGISKTPDGKRRMTAPAWSPNGGAKPTT